MAANEPQIKIGTEFHHMIGDANVRWTVTGTAGSAAWECTASDDDPDHAGRVDVFGHDRIVAIKKWETTMDQMARTEREFRRSLKVGQTVHYHNSFGRYLRCTVVSVGGKDSYSLLPIAAVGAWTEHDLPRWYDNGRYSAGDYSIQKIAQATTFAPHTSTLYECPGFVKPNGPRHGFDPRTLDPIDLTPPAPTDEQAEAADLLAKIEKIHRTLGQHDPSVDYITQYKDKLRKVASIADAALCDNDTDIAPRM